MLLHFAPFDTKSKRATQSVGRQKLRTRPTVITKWRRADKKLLTNCKIQFPSFALTKGKFCERDSSFRLKISQSLRGPYLSFSRLVLNTSTSLPESSPIQQLPKLVTSDKTLSDLLIPATWVFSICKLYSILNKPARGFYTKSIAYARVNMFHDHPAFPSCTVISCAPQSFIISSLPYSSRHCIEETTS